MTNTVVLIVTKVMTIWWLYSTVVYCMLLKLGFFITMSLTADADFAEVYVTDNLAVYFFFFRFIPFLCLSVSLLARRKFEHCNYNFLNNFVHIFRKQ